MSKESVIETITQELRTKQRISTDTAVPRTDEAEFSILMLSTIVSRMAVWFEDEVIAEKATLTDSEWESFVKEVERLLLEKTEEINDNLAASFFFVSRWTSLRRKVAFHLVGKSKPKKTTKYTQKERKKAAIRRAKETNVVQRNIINLAEMEEWLLELETEKQFIRDRSDRVSHGLKEVLSAIVLSTYALCKDSQVTLIGNKDDVARIETIFFDLKQKYSIYFDDDQKAFHHFREAVEKRS